MALDRLPERTEQKEYPPGVEKVTMEGEEMRGRRISLLGEDCQVTAKKCLVIGAMTPAFGGLLATWAAS